MNEHLVEQVSGCFPAQPRRPLLEVEQHFDARIDDIPAASGAAAAASPCSASGPACVAVGANRGISNLPVIVRGWWRKCVQPAPIPSSFRPWAATAAPPRRPDRNARQPGRDAGSVGAEILATMEVNEIGRLPDGPPLWDANAAAAMPRCSSTSQAAH